LLGFNIDEEIENISDEKINKLIHIFFDSNDKKIQLGKFSIFFEFIKENHFLTYCICSAKDNNGKLLLTKLIKNFKLKKVNIDELYECIKINATCILTRVSRWETTEIPLFSRYTVNEKIKCYSAEFRENNKWGYKSKNIAYRIMYYGNRVIWITKGATIEEPEYFLLQKGKINGISYHHKNITIYKNLDKSFDEVLGISLDGIIQNINAYNFDIESINIDLSDYFYIGFFYKGMLFDKNWKGEISKIKNIYFEDDLLKIEIENLTYPHTGYALLEVT